MAKANKGIKPDAPDAPEQVSGKKSPVHYQEWYCKITPKGKGEFDIEKLKVTRENVKITDEQAEISNEGRISGGNAHAYLFYLPE